MRRLRERLTAASTGHGGLGALLGQRLRDDLLPRARKLGTVRLAIGLVALLVLLASGLSAGQPDQTAATLADPGAAVAVDPFDAPKAALDITLKLLAVLALAYVSLSVLRRYGLGAGQRSGGMLQVLESTTLAPNRGLYVVRVGDRRLLLGVTTSQITTLAELDHEERDPPAARAGQPADFQSILDATPGR